MSGLPLRQLLGIFVRDLIVAEAYAARASADFLRIAGFTGGKSTADWGQVKFITFSYKTEDPDGTVVRTIRVPLLSLLPIPLQQIDEAEYEFFAKVNDVEQLKRSARKRDWAEGTLASRYDLVCEVAPYSHEIPIAKADGIRKIRIRLKVRQSDLPAGLASTLRQLEQTSGSKTK
jgi:hypothetical protein